MSPSYTLEDPSCVSFPRVSGDEPRNLGRGQAPIEFSPRERG